PVQIDSDGVTDALLWSGDTVVVLRGRAEGGVGYWAAFEAKSGTVGAALVQDIDEDALVDLIVVVNGEETSQVAWMPGDGLGGFTTTAVLDTDYRVYGVTAEDFDRSGSAELSLLTEDGILRRYDNTGDGWQAASQSDFTLAVGEGGRVLGGRDLTEDGWYDVAIAGPIIGSEAHTAWVTSPGGTSIIISYRLEDSISGGSGLAIADADLDGDPDVFVAVDGTLRRYSWSETSGTFNARSHTSMPDHARIDAVDLDGDGLVDVVYPGAPSFALLSTSKQDDPDTADNEALGWTTRTPTAGVFALDLAALPWAGDFNADGLVDLVAFVNTDGLELVAFYGDGEASGGAETFREGSSEQLGGGATPLALAVCGSDSWALTSEGGVTRLWHHSLDAFGTLALAGSLEVNAITVACGNFEAGSAAAVSGTGDVTYVAGDGSTTVASLGEDVVEVAAGDLDGDGFDELHACTGACSIAAGDCSGDGLDDLLVNDGTRTTLSIAGVAHDLDFNGWVSLGDADGDGVLDANVQADGVAVAFRGLGGRPGVPMASFMLRMWRRRRRGAATSTETAFPTCSTSAPTPTSATRWTGRAPCCMRRPLTRQSSPGGEEFHGHALVRPRCNRADRLAAGASPGGSRPRGARAGSRRGGRGRRPRRRGNPRGGRPRRRRGARARARGRRHLLAHGGGHPRRRPRRRRPAQPRGYREARRRRRAGGPRQPRLRVELRGVRRPERPVGGRGLPARASHPLRRGQGRRRAGGGGVGGPRPHRPHRGGVRPGAALLPGRSDGGRARLVARRGSQPRAHRPRG
ncbi:MAG: VCBS repeat-containing protein, partial [Deltaproteobacteria bacterium]|nr:VCBS repeat-containing protein [Deltaproteobacteria bacterium]